MSMWICMIFWITLFTIINPFHSLFHSFAGIHLKQLVHGNNRLNRCKSLIRMTNKLPVTVLSGFLGSGKTTLLKNILQSDHKGKRYAVIVNDMNKMNLDGAFVKSHVQRQEEKLVEMSNGCICCTLREDLLKEVYELAKTERYDHLVIESTGVSEPLPVAETFSYDGDDVKTSDGALISLTNLTEVHHMITLVDAYNFIREFNDADYLQHRGMGANENDTRSITDLLVDQIEFASLIVINKCDLVDEKELLRVSQVVKALNSDAKLLYANHSQIDIEDMMNSKTYDFEKVSQSATWIKGINSDAIKIPETEEYGISSVLYQSHRPFHPERLMQFVENEMTQFDDESDSKMTIIRSKGFFWLASRPTEMLVWSQAGGVFQMTPSGIWWADTERELWPLEGDFDALNSSLESQEEEYVEEWEDLQNIHSMWSEESGDRRQELVFIGTHVNRSDLFEKLDGCLLTEDEMKAGPTNWETDLVDPFPTYASEDGDDEEEEFEMLLNERNKRIK